MRHVHGQRPRDSLFGDDALCIETGVGRLGGADGCLRKTLLQATVACRMYIVRTPGVMVAGNSGWNMHVSISCQMLALTMLRCAGKLNSGHIGFLFPGEDEVRSAAESVLHKNLHGSCVVSNAELDMGGDTATCRTPSPLPNRQIRRHGILEGVC